MAEPDRKPACPLCHRPYSFPVGQWTWNCRCGLVIKRKLTPEEQDLSDRCQVCEGSGVVPRLEVREGERPVLSWGVPCPSCPKGREWGVSSESDLRFYVEWRTARDLGERACYWRYVCDLHTKLIELKRDRPSIRDKIRSRRAKDAESEGEAIDRPAARGTEGAGDEERG